MQELRDWCEAVPSPAPSRLTKAQSRLDAAIAREADRRRSFALARRAVLLSRSRWPRWVAPLVSAAAVIAVVAGTFAVASAVRGIHGPAGPAAGTYPGMVCILSQGGIVTRIRDGRVLAPIHVAPSSDAIAVTPDGQTAYVAEPHGAHRAGVVIPIRLATGRVLRPIPVGIGPGAISVTADGKTAYVTNAVSRTVTPIATATNTALSPINVQPPASIRSQIFGYVQVLIAPDDRTLYASYMSYGVVITPVNAATGAALHPLQIPSTGSGTWRNSVAVTPDSKTVYVIGGALRNSGTLTAIRGDRTLKPIVVPLTAISLTIGPDGKTAYVVSAARFRVRGRSDRYLITPVDLADGATLRSMTVRGSPNGFGDVVIASGGKTGYFLDTLRGAVTPIHLAAGTVGKPIPTGDGLYNGSPQALLFGQNASIGYLVKFNQVVPLNTATNTTLAPIKLPTIIGWSEAAQR